MINHRAMPLYKIGVIQQYSVYNKPVPFSYQHHHVVYVLTFRIAFKSVSHSLSRIRCSMSPSTDIPYSVIKGHRCNCDNFAIDSYNYYFLLRLHQNTTPVGYWYSSLGYYYLYCILYLTVVWLKDFGWKTCLLMLLGRHPVTYNVRHEALDIISMYFNGEYRVGHMHYIITMINSLYTKLKERRNWEQSEIRGTLQCKAKRQYLLTCKVSRYCLLALHGSTVMLLTSIRNINMWEFIEKKPAMFQS